MFRAHQILVKHAHFLIVHCILHEYRLSCFASIFCVMDGRYFSGGGGVGMVLLLLLFGCVCV